MIWELLEILRTCLKGYPPTKKENHIIHKRQIILIFLTYYVEPFICVFNLALGTEKCL